MNQGLWHIIAFVESWSIAGLTKYQIGDCSVRLAQGLLPAQSVNANSDYTGMWHAFQKLILPTKISSKETALAREGQRSAHNGHGF